MPRLGALQHAGQAIPEGGGGHSGHSVRRGGGCTSTVSQEWLTARMSWSPLERASLVLQVPSRANRLMAIGQAAGARLALAPPALWPVRRLDRDTRVHRLLHT
jgi:hypothetical protein